MFAKDSLTYEPIPLPDRHKMTDADMRKSAESFHDFMRKRHSVRQFSDRAVPRDVIENCIRAAGTAPSGANHQPWHFDAICDPDFKRRIREAAEEEEQRFYGGKAGDEWLKALEPIGTNAEKPHLDIAPWLIVVWLTGSGLMIAVVVKLFLVDLANTGSLSRVAAFVFVGLVLLSVGYLSPAPPARQGEPAATVEGRA